MEIFRGGFGGETSVPVTTSSGLSVAGAFAGAGLCPRGRLDVDEDRVWFERESAALRGPKAGEALGVASGGRGRDFPGSGSVFESLSESGPGLCDPPK